MISQIFPVSRKEHEMDDLFRTHRKGLTRDAKERHIFGLGFCYAEREAQVDPQVGQIGFFGP
jgi:hypothetical protein